MSTSDRVCPKDGDIGATPQTNFCPKCGQALMMKSLLRGAAENAVQAAAIGFGVEAGIEAATSIIDAIFD